MLIYAIQVPVKVPLQLRWRHGPDMPFGMRGYVQSVVVQGRVYVGGGWAGCDNSYIVMEYDISSGKWAKLPPHHARDFAMTVINSQLVLVCGLMKHGHVSGVVSLWRAEKKEWSRAYPYVPNARSNCSASIYNEWLAVAGGWRDGLEVSTVDIMNTNEKKWYAGPPTPTPWHNMKTAIVGDTCYFMGGYTEASVDPTAVVYSVSLPALISLRTELNCRDRDGQQHQIWKEIPGLQTVYCTPLSISGSLLVVGGMQDYSAMPLIHLYQPDTGKWVKVGHLSASRCDCICAMITDKEMLVAGGEDCSSDIALMSAL